MTKLNALLIWIFLGIVLIGFAAMGIYDSVTRAEAMSWEKVETTHERYFIREVWVHKVTGEVKYNRVKIPFVEDDLRMLLQEDKR